MFDTRHQSWWRLDDPSTHEAYNVYAVSENNRLYAFPYQQTAVRTTVWSTAEPATLASSWSWKSQPIAETRDIAYRIRDVEIMATATSIGSLIEVTISGFNESGALITLPVVSFPLSANVDRPQLHTIDVGAHAALSYMQVKITASNNVGQPAPKLHSIAFGTVDTNPIRKVGV